jgi:hypothetical protein
MEKKRFQSLHLGRTKYAKGERDGESKALISLYLYISLVFPRWDVISVVFSVFLLTYTYQEGKANYFKGSILILSYVVLVTGFYYIPSFSEHSILIGVPP